MTNLTEQVTFVDVTSENVTEVGIFCNKNKKSPGYKAKVEWYKKGFEQGLRMKIAVDGSGKQLGYIEYMPGETAWRPVIAPNYLFIQCIVIFSNDIKNHGLGSKLVTECELEARKNNKSGICTLSSNGPWIAKNQLFEKNNFTIADSLERFDLMIKIFDNNVPAPKIIDWTKQQQQYKGWNLVYADQCPWHEKSVTDLLHSAKENSINLKVIKLETAREAQNAPSGFATFSLIYDGKLLADHYISKTRFENILKQIGFNSKN